MQFEDFRMPTGTRMQLEITGGDYKSQTLMVQLLGYRKGFSLVAYPAKKPVFTIQPPAKVIVRVGLQSAIIRFDSAIEAVSEDPYFYLHLRYPTEVAIEKQLRQAPRFDFEAPISATKPDNQTLAGKILDISLNGARVSFPEEVQAQQIELVATVFAIGEQQELRLKAQIKSLNKPQPETEDEIKFVYGISFVDLSSAQRLLLQALCYELQIKHDT